jgi:hypothetical protein
MEVALLGEVACVDVAIRTKSEASAAVQRSNLPNLNPQKPVISMVYAQSSWL